VALSTSIVSFIIVGFMFIALLIVALKIFNYTSIVTQYLREQSYTSGYSRTSLVVEKAFLINATCINFTLDNKGPQSILLDESSNIIIDYYENNSLTHLVEDLEFNKSWYPILLIVGSKNYTIPRGYILELKPGQETVIEACVSRPVSTQKTIIIVFNTRDGVRAEYVFAP